MLFLLVFLPYFQQICFYSSLYFLFCQQSQYKSHWNAGLDVLVGASLSRRQNHSRKESPVHQKKILFIQGWITQWNDQLG